MRITSFIRSLSKKTKVAIVTGLAVVAVAVPTAAIAVYGPNGPDRVIYDFKNPAQREGAFDAPRFNSYINTDVYGDERQFFDVKECVVTGPECYTNGVNGGFKNRQPVVAGKEYLVRTYVHNIANPSINASGKGVAKNTRVRVEIPEGIGTSFTLQSRIMADNSIPKTVYDTLDLQNSNKAFDVEYVPGSAHISNRAHPNGLKLSDEIVGANGTKIGFDEMNGTVPGCFEFSAFVYMRVKIKAPQLEIKKQVTTPGAAEWHEKIKAKKGDTVSWLINYDIKGASAKDVTIRDVMPKGVTLVPGSITVFDPNNPNGHVVPDTALGAGGMNVGNYAAGSGGAVRFRTVVNQNIENEDPDCKVKNVAFGRATGVTEVSDDAEVEIEDCEPPVENPVYRCDALSATKVSRFEYKFNAEATAENGAEIVSYTYDFGDNTTPLTTDKDSVNHTYTQPGEYAAKVTVNVDVNGETKSDTGEECMVTINIPQKPVTPETPETPKQPKGPKELPDTGMGAVAGIVGAVTAAGTAAHIAITRKRQ